MKIDVSLLRNALLILLVALAGVFAEYRYGLAERITNSIPYSGGLVDQASPGNNLRSTLTESEHPENRADINLDAFWEVWRILERDYLDAEDLDPQTMVDGAISGLTMSLGDPYTTYLPPTDFERSAQDLAGSFYGVGIELGYRDGVLAVVAPLEGTPADRAGIQAGDLIVRVQDDLKDLDEDSRFWSLAHAVEMIRGPEGTSITLTLMREGYPDYLEITVERGEIVVETAVVEFVEHAGQRIAHIKLSRFGTRTNGEWDRVVSQILSQRDQLDGIVLDMRNNPGGLFDGAIEVASDFIADGVIVSQHGKYTSQDFRSTGRGRLTSLPVEVLVNRGSASSAEIVAGAIRDRLGAKLIGESTFGKGTVQDRRSVSGGGGLHVTIARWMLPGGDWIQDEGIPVDIEVTNDPETDVDEVLIRAIEEF